MQCLLLLAAVSLPARVGVVSAELLLTVGPPQGSL